MESAFFSSKKNELTALTRNLDRIIRGWLVHYRVCDSVISGIGLGAVTFKAVTTRLSDRGIAKELSADPLEIPPSLMTRARTKRFKEALNVLIRDAQVNSCVQLQQG